MLPLIWLVVNVVLYIVRVTPRYTLWQLRKRQLSTSLLKAAAAAMKCIIEAQRSRASYCDAFDAAVHQLVLYSQVIGVSSLTYQQAKDMLDAADIAHIKLDEVKLPDDAGNKRDLSIDIFHRAVVIAMQDDHISVKEVGALGKLAALLDLDSIPESTTLAIVGMVVRQVILDDGLDLADTEEILQIGAKLSMPQLSGDNKIKVLAYAFEMAIADGLVTRAEKTALEIVIMCLGYRRESLDTLLSTYLFARMGTDNGEADTNNRHDEDAPNAWDVLGVNRYCTEAELKEAYRAKMRQWHPDLMSDDRREEATLMAAKINEAYHVMKKSLQSR